MWLRYRRDGDFLDVRGGPYRCYCPHTGICLPSAWCRQYQGPNHYLHEGNIF